MREFHAMVAENGRASKLTKPEYSGFQSWHRAGGRVVRLHITVITGNVTFAVLRRTFTTAMPTFSARERYGEKEKVRRTAEREEFPAVRRFSYWVRTSLRSIALTARAVKDEDQENDDDDPRKSIVFKEVAKASHDKPPGFSAVFWIRAGFPCSGIMICAGAGCVRGT